MESRRAWSSDVRGLRRNNDSGGQVYLHTVPFSVHKDFNIWLISLEMTSFKQGFNS